jgi:phospholipid-binding lipoprotein MlaA
MARKWFLPLFLSTLLFLVPSIFCRTVAFAEDAGDRSDATVEDGAAGRELETPNEDKTLSEISPSGPDFGEDPFAQGDRPHAIADPLEPLNRAFFLFNDKTYFWILRPVARGYRAVLPQDIRVCVKNFFSNIATPIRLVNNLLQGKFRNSGDVLLRFAINTTMGIGGLFDPATNDYHIEPRDEDLGQTLGKYGLGHGFYFVIPLIGPSSLRDGVGLGGDFFLHPATYTNNAKLVLGAYVLYTVNRVSLSIGEYEDLKKSSVDPYVAVRDAYSQYRAKKVRE